MILIVAAFVLVGVGDLFRRPSQDYVFKVAGYKCSEKEWSDALNQQISYISQNIGRQLSQEDLVRGGVYQSVLNRLIDRKVVLLEAEKIGLVVSDAMVQKSIMEYPAFKNKDGVFDKTVFDQFIAQQNISEEKFVQMMRDEVVFESMLNTLGANMLLPPQEVRQLMIASKASKDITAYIIDQKDYVSAQEPTEKDLQEVMQKNKDKFMTPESRAVTYLTFAPQDAAKEKVVISDKEVQDAYEQRKFMFERPERREVFHVVAKTKELAEKAKEALLAGQSFDKVMNDYGNKQTEYKMPEITKSALSPEMGDAVFALKEKAYSDPVKSPMGFHIFMVNKISAADVVPFEQVKQMLRSQMQVEKEFEQFSAFVRALDAEVAGGASLESLAAKYNFKQATANLVVGTKDDGSMKTSANFIQAAFSLNLNQVSSVAPASEGVYFIVRVDGITASQQRELNSVKKDLVSMWRKDLIMSRMYKAAQDLKIALMGGKEPNIAFKTQVIKMNNGYKGDLPDFILRDLAGLKKGEYSEIALNAANNYVFIQMGDTYYPEKDSFSDLKKLIQPDRSQGQVILEQYMGYLRGKYSVDINKKYFDTAAE